MNDLTVLKAASNEGITLEVICECGNDPIPAPLVGAHLWNHHRHGAVMQVRITNPSQSREKE